MVTDKKAKIKSILPLTKMQNALLLHKLASEDDKGFIQVKIDLKGQVDKIKLQECWNLILKRHDALKTSIHWENIKQPVQVIHKEVNLKIQYFDLDANSSYEAQEEEINQYLLQDRSQGFDLTKVPLSKVAIFSFNEFEHRMIWSCHHILVDGWSSSNVINDIAQLYQMKDVSISNFKPVPQSKEYHEDLKKNDNEASKHFWTNYLRNFDKPSLLAPLGSATNQTFQKESINISSEDFDQLNSYCLENKLTITTTLQVAWSMLLSSASQSNDVCFGNIVSHRPPNLVGTEAMVGMFTNMLPVRIKIKENTSILELCNQVQKDQNSTRSFSFANMDEIGGFIDWPDHIPLYDHIFVVENFPWDDISADGLTFSNFRSGITSSYPITIVIKVNQGIQIDFIYNNGVLRSKTIEQLGQSFADVIKLMTSRDHQQVKNVLVHPKLQNVELSTLINLEPEVIEREQKRALVPPSTNIEKMLHSIWQDLMATSNIGVTDNFFELGGKSIMVIRLFKKIEEYFGISAPPIQILNYPTIRQLATFISSNNGEKGWSSIVPLKKEGNKNPIFCLHAKGGYVFFYNRLSSLIDDDTPVYAIQPRGLNGIDPLYDSIEDMSAHYIEEIKKIQAEGPYNILATCFSNAVGLEMAHQLNKNNDKIGSLFMVDASPGKSYKDKIKEQDFARKISSKLGVSSILRKGKKLVKSVTTASKKNSSIDFALQHESHLEKLFNQYERKPYNDEVVLIRSSQFTDLKRKDFHIKDWEDLIGGNNLKVITVEGSHKTLFLDPDVKRLAKALNHHLNKQK